MQSKKPVQYETAVGYFFSAAMLITIALVAFFVFKGDLTFFKYKYIAFYEYGSGITKGTPVTLNGINVGEVVKVDIDNRNRIEVVLSVSKKYADKIRRDSVAKIVRPLLIGNKQISITPGSQKYPVLPHGSVVKSEDSSELVDLVSGLSIERFVKDLDLKKNFFDLTGDNMITAKELYEQVVAAMITLNEFQKSLKEMNDTMQGLSGSVNGMNTSLKAMNELSDKLSEMNATMARVAALDGSMYEVAKSMNSVGSSFNKIAGTMDGLSQEGDDLKPTLERLKGLVDELDIIMKAVQKSWLLKAEVEQVKKEREAGK